jgi:peptidyl-prolyl cis-trans isomerase D
VEAEHRRRNEKVKVEVVAFRGDDFRDDVEATDEDIDLLYQEESLVYQVPEKRKLRFLLLDEGALADSISPSENEIQDYYDFNISQYSTPGQVRASHILLRTEDLEEDVVAARAQELATSARDGADFAALAREHSDDEATAEQGGDLGLFGRGRMVPEFEAAAFILDVDAISDPVKSPFGYHVIKVTEKQEANVQPLDEVRDSIVSTLKREQASARTTALSRSIAAEVSTAAELDSAAASRGLEVQESGFAAPGEPILGLGLAQEVSARAFQIEEGVVEGPIASPLGPAFVTVVDRQDPYVPPLDDVRAQVREDVIRRKALTLARERAAEAATRLQEAEDFAAAAKEADLTVGSSELMSRGGAFPEVGISDTVEALAFALPVGTVSDVVVAGSTAAIVHVVERQDVTAAEFESAREELREELLQQKQDQFFQSYMNTARETIEFSIDQLALDEALGTA